LASDIHQCSKRYIYDDGSSQLETLSLLSNPEYIHVKGKEFQVITNEINRGCRNSYLDALAFIKKENQGEYIVCTVDNDVHVKPTFIQTLIDEYDKASRHYEKHILLTGFNSSISHLTNLDNHDTFFRKHSFGGVNFVFHSDLLDLVSDGWRFHDDWGVNDEMNRNGIPMCCLHKSVINHIGKLGLYSTIGRYDHDDNFYT